ncbi:MAG TPA: hypothetical protein GXZ48_03270 [Acholeplasmataceae bacterium]|nr:hypothetical protein [Acholeplasmataceae bacterium]
MERVIKFPKEKTKIINSFNDAYFREDFQKAASYKDDIINNFDILKNENIFDKLLESLFEIYAFNEIIIIGERLRNFKYESFDLYYYMLLSYVSLVDLYGAKSLIKRSKLLNNESIKYYYEIDGANYSNILGLSEVLFMKAAPCLLIVNYINEVFKETIGNYKIDREYLLYRFFDLINMIYELGYDGWIILRLEKALKIIFEIDI